SWKPRQFTAGGAPVYNSDDMVVSPFFNPQDLTFQGLSPAADSSGHYYNLLNGGLPNGIGFWSGRVGKNHLVSYDSQWKPRWAIGRHATAFAAPGEMYYLWRNDGELANCMFVSDVEGLVHIVHKDGFYVQSLFHDMNKPGTPGPQLLSVENFS